MKKKKVLAVLTSVALFTGMCGTLTGCGDEEGEESAGVVYTIENISEADIGDSIEFSSKEWLVLDKNDNEVLVVCKAFIGPSMTFRRSGLRGDYWEGSAVREYLNGEYYDSLPSEVKKMIIEKEITTTFTGSQQTTESQTSDYIFILSKEEIEKYLPTENERSFGTDTDGLDVFDQDGDYFGATWLRDGYRDAARIKMFMFTVYSVMGILLPLYLLGKNILNLLFICPLNPTSSQKDEHFELICFYETIGVTRSVFYAIRNALAHGSFSVHNNNGKPVYYFQSENKGEIRSQIRLKESTLLQWIKLFNMPVNEVRALNQSQKDKKNKTSKKRKKENIYE